MPDKRQAHATAVLAGTLITGTGAPPVRDAVVVIEDGRIRNVGARAGLTIDSRGTDVVDASDRVVIPGLIDSHCHLWHFWTEPGDLQHRPHDSPAFIVARAIRNAGRWLDTGVTTTREMGIPLNLDIGLRDAINAGVVRGPRLFVSGSGLAVTGGMYGKQAPFRRQTVEFSGPEEARRITRQQIDAGVDVVKLYATAGIGERGHPQMTFEEIRAAVDEAHKAGKTVAAHAMSTEGITLCVNAGVDSIEHGTYLDEQVVALMAAGAVALVPTMSILRTIAERAVQLGRGPAVAENARRVLAVHRKSIRLAYKAGVKIAAGTDPAYGDTVAMECATLVEEVGLTPAEALIAATRSGAELLRRHDDFGTLEPGKRADLLVLNGNPLEDIRALEKVDVVIKDGVVIERTAGARHPAGNTLQKGESG